jgi:3-deoxy-D-manno-octulosonic-acid transferase
MLYIYNIIIKIYGFAIKIHSLYNQKSKQWIDGRKDIFSRLEKEITNDKNISLVPLCISWRVRASK